MVALVIRGHVLGVDAYPLAGDECLEFVFDVVQVRPGHHFVGNQEQAARCPVVEFVLDCALVNDAAVAAVYAHDDLEEHILAGALGAVDHDGGLHLGAGVLDGVGQPFDDPLE